MNVTCVQCGREVTEEETTELPHGKMCDDCYSWLEYLIDEADGHEEEPVEFDDRSL